MANVGDQLLQPEDGWQRIQFNNINIKYIGTHWTIYNSICNYVINGYSGKILLKCKTSRLRIVTITNYDHSTKINIKIDGELYQYSEYSSSTIDNVLVFEKLDLELKDHDIEIYNIDNCVLSIESIDIDEDGYMLAPPIEIGDRVTKPEDGWQRIDDTDSNIKYIGPDWNNYNPSVTGWGVYNDTRHATSYKDSYIEFYVFTSKLRIYNLMYSDHATEKNHYVYINGKLIDKYSSYMSVSISEIGERLVFEKKMDDKEIMCVRIYNVSNSWLALDCIDIDEDGYLLTEEEYEKYNKLKLCNYLININGDYYNNNNLGKEINFSDYINHKNLLPISDITSNINIKNNDYKIIRYDNSNDQIKRSISYNNKEYKLALKIFNDNDEFYYDNDLWTNDILLNEKDYSNSLKNSKYKAFTDRPVNDIILILNEKEFHIHLEEQTNSLKDLFINGGTITSDDYIDHSDISPFGFDRYDEIYNVKLAVNYKCGYGYCKFRLGILLNDVPQFYTSGNVGATCEGIGLYTDSRGIGITQNSNSGSQGWYVYKVFSKALVYVG